VGLSRRQSANAADTVSATVDVKAVDLPAGWRSAVAGARDHRDELKAAAEIASPNAPTGVATSDDDEVALESFTAVLVPQDDRYDPHAVAVHCAGAGQVGWTPPSLCADACRQGPGTE
jgi:hypothetical protein